jgi:hypothetical protein
MKRAPGVAVVFGITTLVSAQAQAPAPGPEYQRLGYFVGTWNMEGEVKPNPFGAPAGKISGTQTCNEFPGRFEVVCNLDLKIGGAPYREMGIFGYDPESSTYTWYDIDSKGFNAFGHGTPQGSTWTFAWELRSGGKPLGLRTRLVEQSPTVLVNESEFSLDHGPWVRLIESKNTKTK